MSQVKRTRVLYVTRKVTSGKQVTFGALVKEFHPGLITHDECSCPCWRKPDFIQQRTCCLAERCYMWNNSSAKCRNFACTPQQTGCLYALHGLRCSQHWNSIEHRRIKRYHHRFMDNVKGQARERVPWYFFCIIVFSCKWLFRGRLHYFPYNTATTALACPMLTGNLWVLAFQATFSLRHRKPVVEHQNY